MEERPELRAGMQGRQHCLPSRSAKACASPPYKPPQNVAHHKGSDAASRRLLQSDHPANTDCSEGRGWHVGLCKALCGAVQELAIDLVVQTTTS